MQSVRTPLFRNRVRVFTTLASDLTNYVSNLRFCIRRRFVDIPQGPGLGVEVNEDFVRAQAETSHRWRNPIWRHPDGSIAEW